MLLPQKINIPIRFDNGNNIWFTSDTHFYHTNIIKYCDRPFKSIEEMNECLITNWNNNVKPDDYIFHLGDFAFAGSGDVKKIESSLNGHIILIKGNHDEKIFKKPINCNHIEWITYQMSINVEGQKIYLNHYPFLCYSGTYRKKSDIVWQLFGHVHTRKGQISKDSDRMSMLFPYQYDVGVDNNDYRPVNFYEVKQIIDKQTNNYERQEP